MPLHILHKNFAKALYQVAKDNGTLLQVFQNCQTLSNDYLSQKAVQDFIHNPLYKPTQKIKILQKIIPDNFEVTTLNFLKLLIQKKREPHLKNILIQFNQLHQEIQHIQTTQLTTTQAIPRILREKLLKHIQYLTSNPQIELIEKVDPTLIGGYILTIYHQQLDMSIRTQLSRLKTHWQNHLPLLPTKHTIS